VPSVPEGERLDFGGPEFREYERSGAAEAGHAAFVLVAGGLGERLGYSGIKLSLPADLARGACFLQVRKSVSEHRQGARMQALPSQCLGRHRRSCESAVLSLHTSISMVVVE